jgi:hypothetical protein
MALGDRVLLHGKEGSGKTLFAVHMATQISRGRDLFGSSTRRGAILYLAAEDPDVVERRFAVQPQQSDERSLPIAIARDRCRLVTSSDDAQRIVATAAAFSIEAELTVEMIILDNLRQLFESESENDDKPMARFLENVRIIGEATGATVVIITHEAVDGPGRSRGHSSLPAAVDLRFAISKRGDQRTVRIAKQRDGHAEGTTFGFSLRQASIEPKAGVTIASVMAVEDFDKKPLTDGPAPKSTNHHKTREFEQRVRLTRELLISLNGKGGAIELHEARRCFREAGLCRDTSDAARKGLDAMIRELERRGAITLQGNSIHVRHS